MGADLASMDEGGFLSSKFDRGAYDLKNSSHTQFNHDKFKEFVEDSQNETISPEYQGLPALNKKYIIMDKLGEGAFGLVLKVKHRKSNELFAVKCVPMSKKKQGEEKWESEEKERVLQSAKTELKLLPKLRHANVVRYIENFVEKHDPMKRSGGDPHLCLVMEYVRGSDLDRLLEFNESNKFELGGCVKILWFLKLLKTLAFFHKMGILHRDLKPDNILVYYADLGDVDSMNLKISDFGLARNTKKDGLDDQISGHIFYAAPEILNEVKYDSLCDVWSLGIILLQVFYGISIDTYQNRMKALFKGVKENKDKNSQFCKRFNLRDIYTGTTFIKLMAYLHGTGMFQNDFINPLYTHKKMDKSGLKVILELMVCPVKKRMYSKDLLKHPIIKTWEKVLAKEFVTNPSSLDVRGLMTFVKISEKPHDLPFLLHALQIIATLIPKKHDKFVKLGAVQLLLEKFVVFQAIKQVGLRIVKCFVNMIVRDSSIIHCLSVGLRENFLIDAVRNLAETGGGGDQQDEDIYFFVFALVKKCTSFRVLFRESVPGFFKIFEKTYNRILFYILEELVPHIDDVDSLERLLNEYIYNDVLFCRRATFENVPRAQGIRKILFTRGQNRLQELITEDRSNVSEIADNLLMLLFTFAGEMPERRFVQYRMGRPNEKNSLSYLTQGKGSKITGLEIIGNSSSRRDVTEVKSTRPVCVMAGNMKNDGSRIAGYFESVVWDGGNTDDFGVGIVVKRTQKRFYVGLVDGNLYTGTSPRKRKLCKFIKMPGHSSAIIGIGITGACKLMVTYNGQMVNPQNELGKAEIRANDEIYAYWRVGGNDFLRIQANFGSSPFFTKFGLPGNEQQRKKRQVYPIDVKLLQNICGMYAKNYVISKAAKALMDVKRTGVTVVADQKLASEYKKDKSIADVSKLNRSFVLPEKGAQKNKGPFKLLEATPGQAPRVKKAPISPRLTRRVPKIPVSVRLSTPPMRNLPPRRQNSVPPRNKSLRGARGRGGGGKRKTHVPRPPRRKR